MKGCFLLQRRFARVGHAMALVFKKKYGVQKFCGYTGTRSSYDFLQKQKDIVYSKILFDEEIYNKYPAEKIDEHYLRNLEKQYGLPNLWPYLVVDRILTRGQFLREYPYYDCQYSHKDLLKILQVTSKEIINFLEEEKPDFCFFPAVASLGTFLLYEIAKRKGIKIFYGELSRFAGQYIVTDDYRGFPSLTERFQKIQRGEIAPTTEQKAKAKSLFESFVFAPVSYHQSMTPQGQPINRRRQLSFLLPYKIYRTLYWLVRTNVEYIKNRHDYTTVNPWFYLWDRLKRKVRVLRGYEDLYDKIDPQDKYAYFPLSVEPELSLLLYAQFTNNQIEIVKQVAQSLPVGYKLYVKEHPVMAGHRTRKFYKELKKMPNVKLIRPEVYNYDLIRNCKLVTTITGSSGWEAALLGKPIITFGETFYNALSAVKFCQSMPELPYLVKQQLENFVHHKQELLDFIAALEEDSAPLDMTDTWERENDFKKIVIEIEPLVDLLAEKLGLNT